MDRKFKGIWIPKEIWLTNNLTLQEKVFLVEIDSLDNNDGCYASNKYFADFFGISKRRASDVINSLVSKEYITSNIIYKENSKQVLKRVLKISSIGYSSFLLGGIEESVHTPIEEKFQENNISFNNTINKNNNTSFQKQVFEYWVEQSINNECLTKHKKYTKDMETALRSVANTYKYDFAKCKESIDRFCLVAKKSQKSKYPLKKRTLQEFFGQRAYQSKSLIFQEYGDEGCKWLNYKNNSSADDSKAKATTTDTVNSEALRKAQEFMQRRKEGCC